MKKSPNKKRRRGSIIAFEMIRLDRDATEPLHQQLYRQIRDELAAGSFNHSSSRLPSTRALAADLGIARMTVKLAFEKLDAEGYLRAKTGSGTFVADSLPETFLSSRKPKPEPQKEGPARLSERVKNIPDSRVGKQFDLGIAGAPGVSFVPALAAIDEFPIETWSGFGRKCWLKREPACSSTRRATATPICVKRSRLTCAISGERAVIRIKLWSQRERSRL